MPIPLLTTKLYAPPRRLDMVSRPRLLQKLKHGLHHGHRVTLVSAPAGFGKTTLVSAWLFEKDEGTRSGLKDESKEPKKKLHSASRLSISHPSKAAWLSLDAGDNDPVRFLTYLVATLQKEVDSLGQSIQDMLASPPLPPLETLITVLVNDLTTVAGSLVLVLDDYHVISAEAIHRAVQFLIEHQPPNFHLMLTTRADPPLSLARWRVCYQITEIRVDDLRFSLA